MSFWEDPRHWLGGRYVGPVGDFIDGDHVVHVDAEGTATRRTQAAHDRWMIERQRKRRAPA